MKKDKKENLDLEGGVMASWLNGRQTADKWRDWGAEAYRESGAVPLKDEEEAEEESATIKNYPSTNQKLKKNVQLKRVVPGAL